MIVCNASFMRRGRPEVDEVDGESDMELPGMLSARRPSCSQGGLNGDVLADVVHRHQSDQFAAAQNRHGVTPTTLESLEGRFAHFPCGNRLEFSLHRLAHGGLPAAARQGRQQIPPSQDSHHATALHHWGGGKSGKGDRRICWRDWVTCNRSQAGVWLIFRREDARARHERVRRKMCLTPSGAADQASTP